MDVENQRIPVMHQPVIPPITGFQITIFGGLFGRAFSMYFATIGFYLGVLVFIAQGTRAVVPAGSYETRNVTHAIWYYSMALIFGFVVSPFASLIGHFIGASIDAMIACCEN